jgi:hypothetical protein
MLNYDNLRGRWQSIFCCHERTFKKNDVIVSFDKQRIQLLLYLFKSITFVRRRFSPQNLKYLSQSFLRPSHLPEGDFCVLLKFQPLGRVRFALYDSCAYELPISSIAYLVF